MPLFNMTDLRTRLEHGERLIGVDPGARSIGLALSDVSLLLATPPPPRRPGHLAAPAAGLGRRARAARGGGLVVGLPLSMDGTAGAAAQAARDWTHALMAATGLPAALWDERLSSAAVNRFLISEADATRQRRAELVDQMAAAYMLQSALDASRPGQH